jgi:GNAT superfamily N-acetyltransferase
VTAAQIELRPVEPGDGPAVMQLLAESLGWDETDAFESFFDWKHRQNPFGPSPAWIAVDGDRVVGFRTFLRWRFRTPGGKILDAVRAVDTATHPDYQGRGIFRRLTLAALDELRAGGVDFVFNTPNDQSRPGYLSMGWSVVGRLPAAVRVVRPAALGRMLSARAPASRWPVATTAGRPAAEVLASPELDGVVTRLPARPGAGTALTPEYLRWRYSPPALGYRVETAPDGIASGGVVFRLRRRGRALEATVCQLIVPEGSRTRPGRLVAALLRETGADYAIMLGGRARGAGTVTVPRLGPILTCRPLSGAAPPLRVGAWTLELGDVELL